jgi:hypothetical protein
MRARASACDMKLVPADRGGLGAEAPPRFGLVISMKSAAMRFARGLSNCCAVIPAESDSPSE